MEVLYSDVGKRNPDIQITNTIESVSVSDSVREFEKVVAEVVRDRVIVPFPELHSAVITIHTDDFKIIIKPKFLEGDSHGDYY